MRVFGSFCTKIERKQANLSQLSLRAVLFLMLIGSIPASACPDKCECSTTTVKCINQDLLTIPQPLPTNIKTLFVTGNNISCLTNESFPMLLDQLTDVYLTGNHIKQVDPKVFDNLPSLRQLDLSNNRIMKFSAEAFHDDNKMQELNLSMSLYNYSYVDVFSKLLNRSTPRLSKLDLSNNDLVFLPDGLFSGLFNLTTLDLRNNSIVSIRNSILRNPLLSELDLRDNALKELSNGTLADLGLNPGLKVHLSGNSWQCDCNIEDMLAWLQSAELVVDRLNLTCTEPELLRLTPLLHLDRSELECFMKGDMKGVLETSYVFLGMVLALIGVIFLLVLYLNRKGIKKWIYNIRDACRDHMEGYHYRYEVNSDPRLANLSLNSDV